MKLKRTPSLFLFGLLLSLVAGGVANAAETQGATAASDTTGLAALFTLIGALSAATQRLVEIIKGWLNGWSWLSKPVDLTEDEKKDAVKLKTFMDDTAKYERVVHTLAAICGVLTAWVSWPVIATLKVVGEVLKEKDLYVPVGDVFWHPYDHSDTLWFIVVIGLLASSTSGPWNSLADWLKGLKKPGTP